MSTATTAAAVARQFLQTGSNPKVYTRSTALTLLEALDLGQYNAQEPIVLTIPNGVVTMSTNFTSALSKPERDGLMAIGMQVLVTGELACSNDTKEAGQFPMMIATSDIGNHVFASTHQESLEDLARRVIESNGSDDTLIVNVDWVSYKFGKTDPTYAGTWIDDENVQENRTDIDDFLNKYSSTKYRMALQLGGDRSGLYINQSGC